MKILGVSKRILRNLLGFIDVWPGVEEREVAGLERGSMVVPIIGGGIIFLYVWGIKFKRRPDRRGSLSETTQSVLERQGPCLFALLVLKWSFVKRVCSQWSINTDKKW